MTIHALPPNPSPEVLADGHRATGSAFAVDRLAGAAQLDSLIWLNKVKWAVVYFPKMFFIFSGGLHHELS